MAYKHGATWDWEQSLCKEDIENKVQKAFESAIQSKTDAFYKAHRTLDVKAMSQATGALNSLMTGPSTNHVGNGPAFSRRRTNMINNCRPVKSYPQWNYAFELQPGEGLTLSQSNTVLIGSKVVHTSSREKITESNLNASVGIGCDIFTASVS